jgi:hypothetical protein
MKQFLTLFGFIFLSGIIIAIADSLTGFQAANGLGLVIHNLLEMLAGAGIAILTLSFYDEK